MPEPFIIEASLVPRPTDGCSRSLAAFRRISRATEILGATSTWLSYPDAIYRGELYLSDEDLFGDVKPEDRPELGKAFAAVPEPAAIWAVVVAGAAILPRRCRRHRPA